MAIANYGSSEHVDPIMKDIERFNLFEHVVELEAYGMTVVPRAKMQSRPGFVEDLRNAIIRTHEKRSGSSVGDYTKTNSVKQTGRGWDLIEEDDVFVEAAINPVVLTLSRWLCGQSAILGGQTWILKGPDGAPLNLHSDSHGIPPGAGQIAHMCNASWLCTDYASADDGPTVFIPGSHKFGRATLPHETNLETTPFKYFPLIAEAGSMAIWNGATWHGAAPRKNPGLRVTLVQNYFRPYMRTMINYCGKVSPQLLQKYPELERAIGKPLYPYDDPQGPDPQRIAPTMRAGTNPFA
jgi:hypothetical protein